MQELILLAHVWENAAPQITQFKLSDYTMSIKKSQRLRVCPKEVTQAYTPHQKYRLVNAVALPAPSRAGNFGFQANGWADYL